MSACCMVTWIFMFCLQGGRGGPPPGLGRQGSAEVQAVILPFPGGGIHLPLVQGKTFVRSGGDCVNDIDVKVKVRLLDLQQRQRHQADERHAYFLLRSAGSVAVRKIKADEPQRPVEPSAGL